MSLQRSGGSCKTTNVLRDAARYAYKLTPRANRDPIGSLDHRQDICLLLKKHVPTKYFVQQTSSPANDLIAAAIDYFHDVTKDDEPTGPSPSSNAAAQTGNLSSQTSPQAKQQSSLPTKASTKKPESTQTLTSKSRPAPAHTNSKTTRELLFVPKDPQNAHLSLARLSLSTEMNTSKKRKLDEDQSTALGEDEVCDEGGSLKVKKARKGKEKAIAFEKSCESEKEKDAVSAAATQGARYSTIPVISPTKKTSATNDKPTPSVSKNATPKTGKTNPVAPGPAAGKTQSAVTGNGDDSSSESDSDSDPESDSSTSSEDGGQFSPPAQARTSTAPPAPIVDDDITFIHAFTSNAKATPKLTATSRPALAEAADHSAERLPSPEPTIDPANQEKQGPVFHVDVVTRGLQKKNNQIKFYQQLLGEAGITMDQVEEIETRVFDLDDSLDNAYDYVCSERETKRRARQEKRARRV